MMSVNCYHCGFPLGHINDACLRCLPNFYSTPHHAPSADPRPAAQPGAVKALEWERGVVDWARPLPGMKYVACSTTPQGSWGWWLEGAPETGSVHPSEAEAKAAAQADYEKRILSALASPTDADAAVTWRSMDSAPKDGTRFLAFEAKRESQRYECWWQDDFTNWEGWQDDWDSEPDPTHWMPLPAAPLTAAKAGEDGR